MLGISTLNVSNTDGKHLLTLIRCLQIAPWQSHPLVIVVQIAKNEERTSHSRENFRAKTFLEFPFLVKKILLILYEIYYCQTAYFPKLGRNIQKITLNLSKIKSAHFPFNPLDVIKILSPECTFKQHDLGKTAPLISCCLLLSNMQNLKTQGLNTQTLIGNIHTKFGVNYLTRWSKYKYWSKQCFPLPHT